ncbi:(Fe-S)-binding protein [Sphingomonas lacusdianchii]|uniref:(Fe-S)-binding protein n=1 Tax=Sphingomonas lacusdianchii TaxID=2917992 RepID=UPI001F57918F|nr:(Fe-S)-binding protein [Sphingomonas sp. JXJ CY 53]
MSRPSVALFVTCLVDAMRPAIGFASLKVLEEAGFDVIVPPGQTCCGQPALNSGDHDGAVAIARATIACLEPYDRIVVPSGSCGGTIGVHYPELFADDPAWLARAEALAAKTHELLSFLDAQGWRPDGVALPTTATYHDSCSGLRELGIKRQPRALLSAVGELKQLPLKGAETCCGFGGTFCVKYPAISNAVVEEKAQAIEDSGAALLLAGDLGCLMNMAGKLHRRGSSVRAFHTVEILAGMGDGPAIGEAS